MICFIVCFGFTSISQPVATSEFCEVWRELVRNELRLSESEARALGVRNQRDIVAIKRFARKHCR